MGLALCKSKAGLSLATKRKIEGRCFETDKKKKPLWNSRQHAGRGGRGKRRKRTKPDGRSVRGWGEKRVNTRRSVRGASTQFCEGCSALWLRRTEGGASGDGFDGGRRSSGSSGRGKGGKRRWLMTTCPRHIYVSFMKLVALLFESDV